MCCLFTSTWCLNCDFKFEFVSYIFIRLSKPITSQTRPLYAETTCSMLNITEESHIATFCMFSFIPTTSCLYPDFSSLSIFLKVLNHLV